MITAANNFVTVFPDTVIPDYWNFILFIYLFVCLFVFTSIYSFTAFIIQSINVTFKTFILLPELQMKSYY